MLINLIDVNSGPTCQLQKEIKPTLPNFEVCILHYKPLHRYNRISFCHGLWINSSKDD